MANLENLRVNRRALRVCLILLKDNDLLYHPPLAGADFDPTDYGRSDEFYALEVALDRNYRPPIATTPPPPRPPSPPWFWPGTQHLTDEELEALLQD